MPTVWATTLPNIANASGSNCGSLCWAMYNEAAYRGRQTG